MTRAQQSQLREILLQLTDLRNRLNSIYQETAEELPIKKSLEIGRAVSNLEGAIEHLMEVI